MQYINNKGQIIKSLKNNESGNLEYSLLIKKKKGNKNDLIFFVLLFTYCFNFFYIKKK